MRISFGVRATVAALLLATGLTVSLAPASPVSATSLDATNAVFQFGVTGQTVDDVNDLDEALLPPAAITYRGVTTINATVIDAVVTFVAGANLIGNNAPLNHIRRIDDHLGTGGTFPYIESQLRTTTNLEAWARIRVDFYTAGTYTTPGTGTPVTLTNLSAHFYDTDNLQAVEVNGATTYTLASNTHLTPSASGTGAIKFTSPNVNTSDGSGTSYTVGRVTATYASTSTIEYRLFVPAETEGSFDVDISPGVAWVDDNETPTQNVVSAVTFLLPSVQTVTGLRNCPISMPAPVATGFGGTVSFASTSGTAPPGLNFSTGTGAFSGTPTANSSATVDITATGSTSGSATNQVTFDITDPAMTLSPGNQNVNGDTSTAISATTALTPTNPCGTVNYAVTQGTLPSGLSLDPNTGIITGTPTQASSANITITATDTIDNTRTATTTVTFAITAPSQPAQPVILPPAVAVLITQPVPPTTSPTPTTQAPQPPTPPTTQAPQPTAPPTPVLAPNGALPELNSAETLVTENGAPISAELVVENDSDLVLRSQDFELRLRGACTTDCTITEDANGRETIHLDRNGAARVSGFGFLPGSLVHVWIFSEPRYLGALLVAPDGTYDGSFDLADIEVGGHTLQANGLSFDNKNRSANLGIVVVNNNTAPTPGPTALPATGTTTSPALLALALLALGALIMTARRRRTLG